jgi:transposase
MMKKALNNVTNDHIIEANSIGKSNCSIAKELSITARQVPLFLARYQTGLTSRKVGSGRQRKTTVQDDRLLMRTMRSHRDYSAHEILIESGVQIIGERTVRRRLTESGDFNSYWKIKKPFISEINRARRINWALEHRE